MAKTNLLPLKNADDADQESGESKIKRQRYGTAEPQPKTNSSTQRKGVSRGKMRKINNSPRRLGDTEKKSTQIRPNTGKFSF